MQHILARIGGLGIATHMSLALTVFIQAGAALAVAA
jgi:hypothetical protein